MAVKMQKDFELHHLKWLTALLLLAYFTAQFNEFIIELSGVE
jgi:hypothetical protein